MNLDGSNWDFPAVWKDNRSPKKANHAGWGAWSDTQGKICTTGLRLEGLPRKPCWPRTQSLEQRLWTCGLACSLLKAQCGSTSAWAWSGEARMSVHQETVPIDLCEIHSSNQCKSLFYLVLRIKIDFSELSRHLTLLAIDMGWGLKR